MPLAPLPEGVEVEFSSAGADIVGRVAQLILTAKREVLVSVYAMTDLRVLQALSQVSQKGVIVAVLIDRSPPIKQYDTPRFLRGEQIPVIFAKRGTDGKGWHNEHFIVIDREAVILPTADLLSMAKRNNESMVVLRLPALAARYYNNWVTEAEQGDKVP